MYLYQAEDEEKEWCVVLESLRVVMPLLFRSLALPSVLNERIFLNVLTRGKKQEKKEEEEEGIYGLQGYNRVNMQTLAKLDYWHTREIVSFGVHMK